MSLDVREAPAAAGVRVLPDVPAPDLPFTPHGPRPPARHRRPRDLPALAERLWRRPLVVAAVIFAACGPAHALGHIDLVYHAVLIGLALSSLALPLGLLALRRPPAAEPDTFGPDTFGPDTHERGTHERGTHEPGTLEVEQSLR
ncbi:hypothetical protein [Jidongwangia harbinensis]|uniref:hypothetical protein n=1 Tax=Jidongwangia harbinensis TaxID=2878561 RepID=UPI001CDA5429|nr:hypothetical protein [Jidongwangia harbinensis]MCA2213952.1 hypothetical protein [Jidongwangia harbinensis]